MAKSDKEWKQRTLCSDGNCIGIIGADGHCKECGLPYAGELPLPEGDPYVGDDTVADPATQPPSPGENHRGDDDPVPVADTSGDSWENRTLCIDESCIGVVGPDGHCKACGKPHPGKRP